MRVLWWTCNFWPVIGGLEVLGAELSVRLVERGYDLAVIAQDEGGVLPLVDSYAGIPIHRFPFHSALHEADLAKLVTIRRGLEALVDEFQPALVHLHILGPQALFYPMIFGSRPGKLLVTRHEMFNPDHPIGPDTIPARILRTADWVGCCSEAVLQETRRLVPEIASRSSAILNASAMPELEPSELPFTPPCVLCIGRLDRQKGFDVALRAFPEVLARSPGARMVVAGDGPVRQELEDLASDLGVGGAVTFRGWISPDDVSREINDSTVVVIPSRFGEAFGLVALEAAQMARPVIASRVGGLPEVVLDERTGLLVEPGSPSVLSEAMLRVLEDRDLAARLGSSGREHAARFTIEQHTDEYDSLYRQLTEETIDVSTT